MPNARVVALLALGSALFAAACSEDLTGGAACPALCPQQNVVIKDTTFEAITADTSLPGYPLIGTERTLLVATRGDTLDVRAVIRFDTLSTRFTHNGADSDIVALDSAWIQLVIDRTTSKYTAPVRIDLYDVDTTANDTSTAAVRSLFRDDRLIGTTTFDTSAIKDTVDVAIDKAKLLTKILAKSRLRLGIRATSSESVQLSVQSTDVAQPALVFYDPSPDTAVKANFVAPTSETPDEPVLKSELTDYRLVFKAPAVPSPDIIAVGGAEGRRVYLGFNVPSSIVDSSTVIRATLLLTQVPSDTPDQDEFFNIFPQLVTAGKEVTDLAHAALILGAPGGGFDSLRVAPKEAGVREIEIVNALRTWALPSAAQQQRAIVLRTDAEGVLPLEAHFYSLLADAALRPRLRISYALRSHFGIP